MPAKCKTCSRNDVHEINAMLVDDISLRKIMDKFRGLSTGGLQRHKENCIRAVFADVLEQKRAGLLWCVDEMRKEIRDVKAAFPDNPNVRVGLIGKIRDAAELEAKLTGAFIKDAENPADLAKLATIVNDYRNEILERARIFEGTNGKFGAAMPTEAEMRGEIERLCRHQKVDPAKLDSFVAQQEFGSVG